jgi:HPt (histidine-containing phosphotransfer) domain-containing protein
VTQTERARAVPQRQDAPARAARIQDALYRIAEAASAADDLQAFYAAIHRIVGELMYAENLYIALYDEQRDYAETTAGEANDVGAIVRPAHSLKSNSVNVGATVLADRCRTLEADARAGTVPDMQARIADVEAEFGAVRDALLAERAGR